MLRVINEVCGIQRYMAQNCSSGATRPCIAEVLTVQTRPDVHISIHSVTAMKPGQVRNRWLTLNRMRMAPGKYSLQHLACLFTFVPPIKARANLRLTSVEIRNLTNMLKLDRIMYRLSFLDQRLQ